jgi:hypothetical protein
MPETSILNKRRNNCCKACKTINNASHNNNKNVDKIQRKKFLNAYFIQRFSGKIPAGIRVYFK